MKIEIIDSSRGQQLFEQNDILCLNLNAIIRKDYDLEYIFNLLKNKIKSETKVNLNNLASLCYKLNIKYNSDETLCMVKDLISVIKSINNKAEIGLFEVENYLEEDINPYKNLLFVDNELIQIIKPLKDIFSIIGFTDAQVIQVISKYKMSITKYLPNDLINKIPILNEENKKFSYKLKELL